MIDHVTLRVSNLTRSAAWYEQALAPLGHKRFVGDFDGAAGFGVEHPDERGTLWMFDEGNLPHVTCVHLAFVAKDKAMVQAFYDAALAAGGHDNGAPGFRSYSEKYYGAFVLDPDGNNVEAVCML